MTVAAGIWGALLARVLFELWPLWFSRIYAALAALLIGAAVALASLRLVGRRQKGACLASCSWPLALGAIYLLQPAVVPLWGVGALLAGLGGALWLVRRRDAEANPVERLWDVPVPVLALALYVATLAPSVLPGDSGEFQLAAPTLSIPHPTGYPLYLLLGKLFSMLPVGSAAYRLNLFSAAAAAGAVWAVYRAGRALGFRRAPAGIGAALLMVSETCWSEATIAEKYALNAFFVALTLWLGLRWRAERLAGNSGSRWLMAWALCYGLGLAHHRTLLLYAPVYLWLVWSTDRACLSWPTVWRPALCTLVPLALYLLLPLFSSLDPPYAYIRIDSVRAFLDLVLARTYQSGLFRGGWNALPGRLAEFGRLLVRQFGVPGLGLCVTGWVILAWRERRVAWILLAGMAVQAIFALNYYVPNTPVYHLPVYVWLAVCSASAVHALLEALERARMPAWGRSHLSLAWVLLVAALPVALCAARWQGLDQRRAYASLGFDHAYGQLALHAVKENALVISDWLPATVLWYARWVEGLAPTAQVASVDSLEWQWEGLAASALAAGRPVYLSRPLMAAGDRYPLDSAGPLVHVLSRAATEPPPMDHLLGVELGTELRLLGYDRVAVGPNPESDLYVPLGDRIEGGSKLCVTLYWQAIDVPRGDYAVTLLLVDAAGHTRLERQNRHPVGGTYPTSRWQPGQVVADAYVLDLPPYLPSGEYRLQVMIGVPFAEAGLRSPDGSDQVTLGAITVDKPLRWPRSALSVVVRQRFLADLVLMGYDAPRQVVPGETAPVALQWSIVDAPSTLGAGDWRGVYPELWLVHTDGTERQVPPLLRAPGDWRKGALVVQEYSFRAPDDLARLEVRRAGRRAYRLPLRLTAAPPPLANFGGQIRLRSYAYQSAPVKAGDEVRLTLEWEAATAIREPYKVFVHVLGQNGLPVAQQDNEPVNGTYPTTRWTRGERISDTYAFALPADLPPGEYPVEIGLYRISDLSRLPVLDDLQNVVDDKLYLAPLVVR